MMKKLIKVFAHMLAWVPLVMLVYAAFNRQLGGDPQSTLMHELGHWGLVWLLLCLSMTPLRLLTGQAWWISYRRMLGLYSAFYLFLHILTYYAFYLEFELRNLFTEIVKRPYIAVGAIAFVMLVPLVVTSTKNAQRRMGWRWKKLHQLVYSIAALGLIHLTWQSKSDLNEPLWYISWGILLAGMRFYYTKRKRHKELPKQQSVGPPQQKIKQV